MRISFLLLIITIVSLYSQKGLSQIPFKYGIELGFAFSQFSSKETCNTNDTMGINTDKRFISRSTEPIYSPLIGLTVTLPKKHIQYTFGIQYQKIGQRYQCRMNGFNNYFGKFNSIGWTDQTFHKLCIPISVGWSINIWKLQPSLFVGLRPNIFLKGQYYNKSVFIQEKPLSDTTTSVYGFNPVDGKRLERPVIFRLQAICGFSTLIGQNFKFSLCFNYGGLVTYSESRLCDAPYYFTNNDFTASLSYIIPTSTKKYHQKPSTFSSIIF